MNCTPLFTSIPPTMSRLDNRGINIGEAYLKYCVSSWHNSGFELITMNSSAEMLSKNIEKDLRIISVSSDASDRYKKPVLYIKDFFDEIKRAHNGAVAVTNADIVLDFDSVDMECISSLAPNECVILKRIDINSKEERKGVEYNAGYDFFAFHTDIISNFDADELAIGIPWWDHYLPLWLYLKGVRVIKSKKSAYHLRHVERWNLKHWFEIGKKFDKLVEKGFRAEIDNDALNTYLDKIRNARREFKPNSTTRLKSYLNAIRKKDSNYLLQPELNKVANVNIKVIDTWRKET